MPPGFGFDGIDYFFFFFWVESIKETASTFSQLRENKGRAEAPDRGHTVSKFIFST